MADEKRTLDADEVAEIHRKKRILASLVVHDLRNPLSALQGNIELLTEELEEHDSTMVQEILGDCRVLAAKALSLVAGLLDVEELEEGLLDAEPVVAPVAEFAAKAAFGHRATIRARMLNFEIHVPHELSARFDAELMSRLIENLLDNAVRYAPRKGKVIISAYADEKVLIIRVGNNGPPVPESEREKIFGRYYRLEARRAGARANRGLGLYFCKLVAEAHGGTLELIETDDLPACFELRIPQ